MPLSTSSRRLAALAAVGFYWAALFLLTHLPFEPKLHAPRAIRGLDKVVHGVTFWGLAVLACVAIQAFRPPTARILIATMAVLAVYAALDELTQGLVRHRESDFKDWVADVLGVAAGVISFAIAHRALVRRGSQLLVTEEHSPAADG